MDQENGMDLQSSNRDAHMDGEKNLVPFVLQYGKHYLWQGGHDILSLALFSVVQQESQQDIKQYYFVFYLYRG